MAVMDRFKAAFDAFRGAGASTPSAGHPFWYMMDPGMRTKSNKWITPDNAMEVSAVIERHRPLYVFESLEEKNNITDCPNCLI